MAGKTEVLERTLFRDGNRASTMREQDASGSTQRVSNSGNVPTEAIKDTVLTSVTRRLKVRNLSPLIFLLDCVILILENMLRMS